VETLEVTRWLGCRNLRGHYCRGPRIEIPLVVAISDSSTGGNFNNHTGTGISDSSADSNFNNHTGTGISDSSSGGTSGYTATGSSDSSSYRNTSGRNAAAGDSCNSFDNFEYSSQPPTGGANCQIYGNSYNDCSRRQCEAFL
jgi:hypothetical protein